MHHRLISNKIQKTNSTKTLKSPKDERFEVGTEDTGKAHEEVELHPLQCLRKLIKKLVPTHPHDSLKNHLKSQF